MVVELRPRQEPVRYASYHRNPNAPRPKSPPKPKTPTGPIHKNKHFHWILGGGLVLCFNAGYTNSITLSTASKSPSAHVTGMIGRASIALPAGDYSMLALCLIAWASFLCGATTTGSIISYESFYLGRSYGRALYLVSLVLLLALMIEDYSPDSTLFVYFCAFAMGMQNALTSKYSGNTVRTTHLTGLTTDLGITIAHILKRRPNEWWKIKIFVTSIVGFFVGGVTGWFGYNKFRHVALLLSIFTTACAASAHTLYLAYHEQISILRVLESRTDIRIHVPRTPPHGGTVGTTTVADQHNIGYTSPFGSQTFSPARSRHSDEDPDHHDAHHHMEDEELGDRGRHIWGAVLDERKAPEAGTPTQRMVRNWSGLSAEPPLSRFMSARQFLDEDDLEVVPMPEELNESEFDEGDVARESEAMDEADSPPAPSSRQSSLRR